MHNERCLNNGLSNTQRCTLKYYLCIHQQSNKEQQLLDKCQFGYLYVKK